MSVWLQRLALSALFLALFVAAPVTRSHAQEVDIAIPLGADGFDMEIDEARNLLYVSLPTTNEIVLISTQTFEIVDRVVVGSQPRGVDLSIDGSRLFVALNGAGAVAVLDLDSLLTTEIVVGTELGDSRTWDVVEAQPDRLFVSANPSSSGFAWIVMVKLDEGNAAVRVADERIIRARPVFEVSPDRQFLYVGEGFSPESVYKLDLSQALAPIVLEDVHGSVGGTRHLELNPDGTRLHLDFGQVLRTNDFTDAGFVEPGVPQFGVSPAIVYVAQAGSPTAIRTFDTNTFLQTGDDILLPCSVTPTQLVILANDTGWLVLGGGEVCGVTSNIFMSAFELKRGKAFLADTGAVALDFTAGFTPGLGSDGLDPASEDVTISFGQFDETLPAGSFSCAASICKYSASGPGIVNAEIRTSPSGQVKIDAEDIGIAQIDLPARISVRIGNDLGSALVNPNGSLNLGPD